MRVTWSRHTHTRSCSGVHCIGSEDISEFTCEAAIADSSLLALLVVAVTGMCLCEVIRYNHVLVAYLIRRLLLLLRAQIISQLVLLTLPLNYCSLDRLLNATFGMFCRRRCQRNRRQSHHSMYNFVRAKQSKNFAVINSNKLRFDRF